MQKCSPIVPILFSPLTQPWNSGWDGSSKRTLGLAVTHLIETLHAQIATSRQALVHPPLHTFHWCWMNCLCKLIRAHALSLSSMKYVQRAELWFAWCFIDSCSVFCYISPSVRKIPIPWWYFSGTFLFNFPSNPSTSIYLHLKYSLWHDQRYLLCNSLLKSELHFTTYKTNLDPANERTLSTLLACL